jgi:hypothetical protein
MDPRGPSRNAPLPVHRDFVTAENVESLLDRHGVARDLDLLSIDVDGNDWWIWRALRSRRPRVVAIEYNAYRGAAASVVVPYDPAFRWRDDDFYGASLLALSRLAPAKGYALLGCDSSGTNAFFVANECLTGRLVATTAERGWRAPAPRSGRLRRSNPRPWLLVGESGEPASDQGSEASVNSPGIER